LIAEAVGWLEVLSVEAGLVRFAVVEVAREAQQDARPKM
jgi:hypothetical protein